MNNEPVAYVDNVWINRPDLAMDLGIGQMFSRCQLSDHQIPLYTHPVSQYKAITNTKIEPTVVSYTHPVKEQELLAEIEALKSVVYWLKENRPEVWDDIQKWRKQ